MRDDALQRVRLVLGDPHVLIRCVARRVKPLPPGTRRKVRSVDRLRVMAKKKVLI